MKHDNQPSSRCQQRMVLLFREGIAFRFWHHYGKPNGTAVRLLRCKPGLFGVRIWEGGLYLGAWWTIRLELVCIHINRFQQNVPDGTREQ